MTMKFTKSRIAVLAMAVMLVASAGAIAAPTNDTSGTDATSTTSDLTDGATIAFDANSSDNYRVEGVYANSTGTDAAVKVVVNDSTNPADGETVYTNESMNELATGSAGTHHEANFSEDELAEVPYQIDENVTVDVVYYNASNTSVNSSYSVTLDTEDSRSVAWVSESSAEDDEDITVNTDAPRTVFDMDVPLTGDESTEFTSERNVSANTEEVVVVLGDANTSDHFSSDFEDIDSASAHSTFSALGGDGVIAQTDGEYVKVYDSELPSDLDADTTAVTYEQVGGQDALVFDVDTDSDDTTKTVSAESDVGMSGYLNAYTFGGLSLGLGTLVIFGSIRHRGE